MAFVRRPHGRASLGAVPTVPGATQQGIFECGGPYEVGNPSCWTHDRVATWFPFNLVMSPNPPASGDQAQATVDALLNQQLRDQQALNAGQVQSSYSDLAAGGLYQAGETVGDVASSAFSWLPWVAGGLGLFALVTLTAGGPRRYGR